MLQQPDGSIQFKAVGDIVAGAQIMQIAADSVTVKYAGRSMVLKLEKKKGPAPIIELILTQYMQSSFVIFAGPVPSIAEVTGTPLRGVPVEVAGGASMAQGGGDR